MTNDIKKIIGNSLDELNLFVDNAYIEKEGVNTFLRIALDAEFIIPIDVVVVATKLINPLIDSSDIMGEHENYILDIYAKEKGDGNNE